MTFDDLTIKGSMPDRPDPGIMGRLYSDGTILYRDNGEAWEVYLDPSNSITDPDTVVVNAGDVVYVPTAPLTATNVQDAIDELVGLIPAAGLADPMTTIGDMIIRNGANTTARLGIGTAGQVLTVASGVPAWAAPTGFADPMTTAGDIIIRNAGNSTTRLPISTNGFVLTLVTGVPAWAASGGGGTPAGSTTEIQFNNAGAFGASSNLKYDGSTLIVERVAGAPAFRSGAFELQSTNPTGNAGFFVNSYYDGTNFKYRASDFAGLTQYGSGHIMFYTAPSGTAGANVSYTEIARGTASANFLVGTSSETGIVGAGNLKVNGEVLVGASTTSRASINVPHGSAPSSPTNGDFWSTTAGFFGRVNGSTVGPFGTGGGGSGTVNTGAINCLAYYPAAGTTIDDAAGLTYDSTTGNLTITAQGSNLNRFVLHAPAGQSPFIDLRANNYSHAASAIGKAGAVNAFLTGSAVGDTCFFINGNNEKFLFGTAVGAAIGFVVDKNNEGISWGGTQTGVLPIKGNVSVFPSSGLATMAVKAAAGESVRILFQPNNDGPAVVDIGSAGSANALLTGSAVGDLCFRVNSNNQRILMATAISRIDLMINASGQVSAERTTASTSVTTGALISKGGLGVAGAGWFGDSVNAPYCLATRFQYNLYSAANSTSTLAVDATNGCSAITINQATLISLTNKAAGRNGYVRLSSGASTYTVTFTAGWKWVGSTMPTTLVASKIAIFSFTCYGTADSDVVASWSYEP